MDKTQATPTVSVIIATYNRSNVLAIAIETVRAQSFQDWELLVIGDACTDDTGAVVAGFGDARIRFHNLAGNVGDQSDRTMRGCAKRGANIWHF